MKTIQILFTAALVALSTFTFAHNTSLNNFKGDWLNIDKNTRGITKLLVKFNAGKPYVQGFGSCSPSDCDWKTIEGNYFTASGENFLTANYAFNSGITKHLVMQRAGDKLILIVSSTYSDSRKSKTSHYIMKKRKKVVSFKGNWINVDKDTRGLTKMIIGGNTTIPSIHGFGSCHPRDCDWSSISGTYSSENNSRLIKAHYKFSTGISKKIVVRRSGSKLKVSTYTTFSDARQPQTNHYTMKRQS